VIRLLIAASSPVVRAGLEALAVSNPELQIVGSFPDLSTAEDLRLDVVLAALPLEEIATAVDGGVLPVVLLTNDAEPVWTLDAVRLGVRALLRRDVPPTVILAAVEAVAAGLAVVDPQNLDALLSSTASAPVEAGGEASVLTERELEVLRMMADGAANKIIAWKLGISEHTVKFHVASILAKLGASSRTEAVTIGIRRGLVLV
jgi:DNA-binding NarL/FixJ family response regulator